MPLHVFIESITADVGQATALSGGNLLQGLSGLWCDPQSQSRGVRAPPGNGRPAIDEDVEARRR